MNGSLSRIVGRAGPGEPAYRSLGETQVGRVLDRYGIPFFYEMPLVVYDRGRYRIWRPDFTLPSLDGLVVEYAGMPDVPDYAAGIRHKAAAYGANGVAAAFVYPSDLYGRAWPGKLIEKLYEVRRTNSYSAPFTAARRGRYGSASGHGMASGYVQPRQ